MNSIGHYIDLKTTTSTDSEKVSFLRIQVDVPLKEFPPIDLGNEKRVALLNQRAENPSKQHSDFPAITRKAARRYENSILRSL